MMGIGNILLTVGGDISNHTGAEDTIIHDESTHSIICKKHDEKVKLEYCQQTNDGWLMPWYIIFS